MRADIHDGSEHNTLQSEAGYIDARPLTASSAKSTCDARPDHTFGSRVDGAMARVDGAMARAFLTFLQHWSGAVTCPAC